MDIIWTYSKPVTRRAEALRLAGALAFHVRRTLIGASA